MKAWSIQSFIKGCFKMFTWRPTFPKETFSDPLSGIRLGVYISHLPLMRATCPDHTILLELINK